MSARRQPWLTTACPVEAGLVPFLLGPQRPVCVTHSFMSLVCPAQGAAPQRGSRTGLVPAGVWSMPLTWRGAGMVGGGVSAQLSSAAPGPQAGQARGAVLRSLCRAVSLEEPPGLQVATLGLWTAGGGAARQAPSSPAREPGPAAAAPHAACLSALALCHPL